MDFEKPTTYKNEKPRKSGVMRVASETADEEDFLEMMEEINVGNKFESKFEREKTIEELSLIRQINEKMRSFVERYGGQFIEVRPENIHIIDKDKLDPDQWRHIKKNMDVRSVPGKYNFGHESIGLLLILGQNIYEFAQILTHEIIHFNSFQSVNVEWDDDKKEEGNLIERRVGMGMMSRKKEEESREYFIQLNEAITEELARRFIRENFGEFPELAESIRYRDEYIHNIDAKNVEAEDVYIRTFQKKKGYWKSHLGISKTYEDERKFLDDLARELYKKNVEQFSSKEEVLSEFFKAALSGKVLSLARLVEKTFGKGSFRDIAIRTSEKRKKTLIGFRSKKEAERESERS